MRIILLGLIIVTSNTFGQVRSVEELTKGKKIGQLKCRKEYFSNNKLKLERCFVSYQYPDKFDVACDSGVTKWYFRNGNLKEADYFSAPCVKDSEIYYWKNGNRKS